MGNLPYYRWYTNERPHVKHERNSTVRDYPVVLNIDGTCAPAPRLASSRTRILVGQLAHCFFRSFTRCCARLSTGRKIATTKHCCWYGHREHMKGATFMPFPKPHIDREKSERWIRAGSREGFGVNNVTKHTNICSLHLICL